MLNLYKFVKIGMYNGHCNSSFARIKMLSNCKDKTYALSLAMARSLYKTFFSVVHVCLAIH